MGNAQKNLSIAFRHIQPETLYSAICQRRSFNASRKASLYLHKHIPENLFQNLAQSEYASCSAEDATLRYRLLRQSMEPIGADQTNEDPSVYYALVRMGMRILQCDGAKPVCRYEELLAWRNVYESLGQDLITTAYLAYVDLSSRYERDEFTWEAIIKTNNKMLHDVLSKGISENHCHLHGSTQSFPLTWACLMNYPNKINEIDTIIDDNLHVTLGRGAKDNVWQWSKRLRWAAYLRAQLFQLLQSGGGSISDLDDRFFSPYSTIKHLVSKLQYSYGALIAQPDGGRFVLDYALTGKVCSGGTAAHSNRLLAGERSFLYRCFRACFDGSLSPENQEWLYLYLLIKSNFRAEMIQVNKQFGFHNFKNYQDRKTTVFESYPAYFAESLRLSVCAGYQNHPIKSFEARITPDKSIQKLNAKITFLDKFILYASNDKPFLNSTFYVLHFIKNPEDIPKTERSREKFLQQPRNECCRQLSKRQALVLADALRCQPKLRSRIIGIDAASSEINCRPEVFGTVFRYLRKLLPLSRTSRSERLHVTYHVGEDFIDLADGLRAIDEAVHCLRLQRNDRIGHALALGVEPRLHYENKGRRVPLYKQTLLDNDIWLLFRARELGIRIEPGLYNELNNRAFELLNEIYGHWLQARGWSASLQLYYNAWKLRGDDPALYQTLPYNGKTGRYSSFNDSMANDLNGLEIYRNDLQMASLYQAYHYDAEVRLKGFRQCELKITPEYIELIKEVQNKLILLLTEKGLLIECNPTSNYLIGSFRRFDKHPIFRFFPPESGNANISVSVNTDDLGVFDTSLENEYIMLSAALERVESPEGVRLYSSDQILRYIERLRELSNAQTFR